MLWDYSTDFAAVQWRVIRVAIEFKRSVYFLTSDHASCANRCVTTGQVGRSGHTRLVFHNGNWNKKIKINHIVIWIFFFCNNKQNVVGSKRGLTEVGVIHGLPGRQPSLVVVAQQLVEEIQSLGADEVLVLTVDEPLPPLTRMPRIEKNSLEMKPLKKKINKKSTHTI